MKHVAYNLITGEVITSNTGNELKRCVERNERWNRTNNFGKGKWVFAHGANAFDKIRNRIF